MSAATLSQRCRDAGDAYFMAMEALGHDVGIELRCTLRQAFDRDQVLGAFEALLHRYPALRMQRLPDPEGEGWSWQPLAEEAALALWARQGPALAVGGRAGPHPGIPLRPHLRQRPGGLRLDRTPAGPAAWRAAPGTGRATEGGGHRGVPAAGAGLFHAPILGPSGLVRAPAGSGPALSARPPARAGRRLGEP